jgi:hypothetical protein
MKQLLATLASAALFGVMCFVPAVHAIDADAIGMVQGNLIQGEVFAKSKAGGQRQLTSGASIYEGDTIETVGEGSVVLMLKDGTFWDVFDDSMLTIEEYNFSDNGSSDSAIYQVHSGNLTYTSGEMGVRGSSIEIKNGNTSIYPRGTSIEFITFLGVTVGRVLEGTARVVSNINGAPTADKVAEEGAWFVKDASGDITVYKNKGQAQVAAKQAYQDAGVTQQSAGVLAAITSILVKKGILTTEVDKDTIGADLLTDTPDQGGGNECDPASPSGGTASQICESLVVF